MTADNSKAFEYREQCPDLRTIARRTFAGKCNGKFYRKRLPILEWLPKYRLKYLFEDIVAGLTVGLTAIPQGIAYAIVAGLPPQFGLYSGFVGCFVYLIFGSCKDITIGPTAIMALMVQKYVHESPDYAILIAFLSGLVILLFGILNLGFLVQFISQPVTIGFTSAAAITIASSQIKSLFGLSGSANDFIDAWHNVFKHIHEIKLWDTVLGVFTIVFLILFQKLKDVKGRWTIVCKYLSLSRNALAVFIGTLLAYLLTIKNGTSPFALTGEVASGFPDIRPPPFSTVVGNRTMEFSDVIGEIGSSMIAIPLIAILESIAIAKAFAKGKRIDATQEMIALGLCNIIGSFFSSMPTTGSFTRTAVNNASGVRTQFGGIFTGLLILLSLGFLTSTFQYIPKTTLAAVILAAMFFMIDFNGIAQVWRTRRIDLIPLFGSLIACLLLGLEFGILFGIGLNVLFLLYTTSRPTIVCEQLFLTTSTTATAATTTTTTTLSTSNINIYTNGNNHNYNNRNILLITPDQSLIFSSAEYFQQKVLKCVANNTMNTIDTITLPNLIIINGHYIHQIDITVAKAIQTIVNDLKVQNNLLILWNWKKQPAGILWRLDQQFADLFIEATDLNELLVEFKLNIDGMVLTTVATT